MPGTNSFRCDSVAMLSAFTLSYFLSVPVDAAVPGVTFDIPFAIECRDVTSPGFAKAHPSDKVIEAKFQVSVLIKKGNEKDIKALVYAIDSPEKRLRVADFLPTKKLGSDIDGTISIVDKTEGSGTAGLTLRYKQGDKQGDASVSGSSQKTHVESYAKLPPKELVVASGTVNREHGVFFKLQPWSQDSLEGKREFACLFVVPKAWRGDWAVVSCTANVLSRGYIWTSEHKGGLAQAYVGLHLSGDAEAATAARGLSEAQDTYADELKRELERNKKQFNDKMSSCGESVAEGLLVKDPSAQMALSAWHLYQRFSSPSPQSNTLSDGEKALKDALDRLKSLAGTR